MVQRGAGLRIDPPDGFGADILVRSSDLAVGSTCPAKGQVVTFSIRRDGELLTAHDVSVDTSTAGGGAPVASPAPSGREPNTAGSIDRALARRRESQAREAVRTAWEYRYDAGLTHRRALDQVGRIDVPDAHWPILSDFLRRVRLDRFERVLLVEGPATDPRRFVVRPDDYHARHPAYEVSDRLRDAPELWSATHPRRRERLERRVYAEYEANRRRAVEARERDGVPVRDVGIHSWSRTTEEDIVRAAVLIDEGTRAVVSAGGLWGSPDEFAQACIQYL
jgi:hypothetical protein